MQLLLRLFSSFFCVPLSDALVEDVGCRLQLIEGCCGSVGERQSVFYAFGETVVEAGSVIRIRPSGLLDELVKFGYILRHGAFSLFQGFQRVSRSLGQVEWSEPLGERFREVSVEPVEGMSPLCERLKVGQGPCPCFVLH